jgi:hypothetical protein
VNGLILPYLWGRVLSLTQFVKFGQGILHHSDKPLIELIVLGLIRLQLEAVGLVVASLATMTARATNPLGALLLLPRSMLRLGRFRTRFTFLWLLLSDSRLLRAYLRTVWSGVTNDTTMMAGWQAF